MTQRKPTRKSSSRLSGGQTKTMVAFAVLALFALVFLITGSDPLGLFNPDGETTQDTDVVTTGGGEDWWQVYFTDPARFNDPNVLAGSIPEKLIDLIDSAQDRIYIAAFEFDLTPVAEALIAAHQRGVDVRWVTDDEYGLLEDENPEHGQFAMLQKAGIKVQADDRGALMHNKFWIFDGRIVWTGSTNITRNGNFRNNNNVIVIDSPALAAIYEREFSEMWEGEFGPRSPSTLEDQLIRIKGTPVNVYFAPEDDVIDQIISIVEDARRSIHIMAFSFTNDGLTQAILSRARDGVGVQTIFERRGSETEYSAMRALYCVRLPVRQDGNPGTFHHKVLIIDQEIVVTGSLNFSNNADESNDENVLIIQNPKIAQVYLQEFERRWVEANPPEAGVISCR